MRNDTPDDPATTRQNRAEMPGQTVAEIAYPCCAHYCAGNPHPGYRDQHREPCRHPSCIGTRIILRVVA